MIKLFTKNPKSNKLSQLVVIQPHGIGDLIATVPMLSGIKQLEPELHLSVVVGSRAAAELISCPSICDETVVFNPVKARIGDKLNLLRWLRRLSPDVCLITHSVSPLKGQLLAWLSGARWRVGSSAAIPLLGYNLNADHIPRAHRVESNLQLARLLFPEMRPGPLHFAIKPENQKIGEQLWEQLGFGSDPVLGIHPGCEPTQPQKRYPIERFLQVAEQFLEVHREAHALIFLGPGDRDLLKKIGVRPPRLAVITDKPLQVVATLLKRVLVLLANDSGLGHVASGMGTPVVSIFGPSDPKLYSPWGDQNLILKLDLECSPCYGKQSYGNCEHISCLNQIKPEMVLEALETIWRKQVQMNKGYRRTDGAGS